MEESLDKSNKNLTNSSEFVLQSLRQKKVDPATRYKTEIWLPKAEQTVNLTKECYDYIENLKLYENITAQESLNLLSKLKQYEINVLNTDSQVKNTFLESKYSLFGTDSAISNSDFLYQQFFKDASKNSTIAFLTKMQNNIKIFENNILKFYNEQITYPDRFYFYSEMIGQNSKIIRKGNQLEITAGIGSFSRNANPEIAIEGKKISLNENGYAVYKKKINNNPGQYSISVIINYTDQDGQKQIIKKDIEYTVAKECD